MDVVVMSPFVSAHRELPYNCSFEEFATALKHHADSWGCEAIGSAILMNKLDKIRTVEGEYIVAMGWYGETYYVCTAVPTTERFKWNKDLRVQKYNWSFELDGR